MGHERSLSRLEQLENLYLDTEEDLFEELCRISLEKEKAPSNEIKKPVIMLKNSVKSLSP
jgi:hypothetical protein